LDRSATTGESAVSTRLRSPWPAFKGHGVSD
jgi:hypothetical protein